MHGAKLDLADRNIQQLLIVLFGFFHGLEHSMEEGLIQKYYHNDLVFITQISEVDTSNQTTDMATQRRGQQQAAPVLRYSVTNKTHFVVN